MIVYGLKSCDTCRKAMKEMRAAGLAPEFVDLRETPLSPDTLTRFHTAFEERLVNRASTTWRGLSEAERAGDPLSLLAAHPALMKRPVIDTGATLTLGWREDARAIVLGREAEG
jgi:arsenate reductase